MLRLVKNYVHDYYKTLYLEFTIIFFKLYRKILIANCRKIVRINKILILSKKVLDLSMDNFHQMSSRFHACPGNVWCDQQAFTVFDLEQWIICGHRFLTKDV